MSIIVDKVKLLGILKSVDISYIMESPILMESRNNILICQETLCFFTKEVSGRIKEQRNKPTKILSNLIFIIYNLMEIYVNFKKDQKVIKVDEEIYNILKDLKANYEQNIKNGKPLDITFLDKITDLLKEVEINLNSQANSKIDNKKILSLEQDNENLNKDLIKKKEQVKSLKNKIKDLQTEIISLKQQLKNLPSAEEVDNLNKKITELNNIIVDNKEQIEDLLKENTSYKSLNNKQKAVFKETLDKISLQNKQLKAQIAEYIDKINKYDNAINENIYNKNIEDVIISYMFENDFTVSELTNCLKGNFNVNKRNIKEAITKLSNRYSFGQIGLRDNEKVYKLGLPENNDFTIENSSSTLDVILISDLHIGSNDNSELDNLEKIYNYAIKNNIKIIINLGDLMDVHIFNEENDLKQLRLYDNLLNDLIKNLPNDPNVVNLILGGNHDKTLLELGLDPIKILCNQRSDYINLGYDHKKVKIGSGTLFLHHFFKKFSNNFIKKYGNYDNEIISLINKYYQKQNLNRDNVYIDIFGHYHISKLSLTDSYITVPSLNKDIYQNGAWRLKIYFNNHNISDIILVPLLVNDKLLESTEINYKKILTKNK